MIELIASDLDGTLLNEMHLTDPIILEGLEKVSESYCTFTVSTGRSLHEHEMSRLGFKNIYCICMNGAVIKDISGTILYSEPIEKDIIKCILDKFYSLDFDFSGKDFTFSTISKEEKIKRFEKIGFKDVAGSPFRIRDFLMDYKFEQSKEDILKEDIYKINCNIQDESICLEFEAFIKKYEDEIVNAPAEKNSFEITSKQANKGNAVAWLAHYLNISEQNVAVFGDGGNDLEMLARFPNSYSPSNACPQAKKAAHYLIGSNADYSVIKKILELI